MKSARPAFPSKPPRKGAVANVRNKIFTGVLLAMPVIATVWIFNFVLQLATSWFPRQHLKGLDGLLGGYLLQLLVLLFILLLFYLVGLLAHHFLGKRAYQFADRLFSGIPLIKNVYLFVRQVCEWVAKSRNSMFQSVVLVEYPRKGCYSIGLVTSQATPLIAAHVRDEAGAPLECVNVFIATTPNPTSGIFLILPKRDVINLDMDVSDAINLIISAGAILPQQTPSASHNPLLEMIDSLAVRDTPPPAP